MILGNTPWTLTTELRFWGWRDSSTGVLLLPPMASQGAVVPSFDFLGISKCGTVGPEFFWLRQSGCWTCFSFATCCGSNPSVQKQLWFVCSACFFLGSSFKNTLRCLSPECHSSELFCGWQRSLIDDQSTNPSWTGFPKNEGLWLTYIYIIQYNSQYAPFFREVGGWAGWLVLESWRKRTQLMLTVEVNSCQNSAENSQSI